MPRCLNCKSEFKRRRPWQRYCAPACGTAKRNSRRNAKVKAALASVGKSRKVKAAVETKTEETTNV